MLAPTVRLFVGGWPRPVCHCRQSQGLCKRWRGQSNVRMSFPSILLVVSNLGCQIPVGKKSTFGDYARFAYSLNHRWNGIP